MQLSPLYARVTPIVGVCNMPKSVFLGEFEQLVLLTFLRLGEQAYALPALKELSRVGLLEALDDTAR